MEELVTRETLAEKVVQQDLRIKELDARIAELHNLINSPEIEDWMKGVPLEAAHQVKRWGTLHDMNKGPLDWYWLIGYLAGKVVSAYMNGDLAKAKHHTISTAAVLLNWHKNISGSDKLIEPGRHPPSDLRFTG